MRSSKAFTANENIIFRSQNQASLEELSNETNLKNTDNFFIIRSHKFEKGYALTSKRACLPNFDSRPSSTAILESGLTNIFDTNVVQYGSREFVSGHIISKGFCVEVLYGFFL